LALELAVQSADVDTALDATHRSLDGFAIEDAIAFEADVLRKLSNNAITPAAHAAIANEALKVASWAIDSERYEDANIWGSWKYRIPLDGVKVYESEELKSVPEFEIPIWVTIPRGTKEITLEIDPLGDNHNDHSVWAFPMFHR
jgi:hypothetical protein